MSLAVARRVGSGTTRRRRTRAVAVLSLVVLSSVASCARVSPPLGSARTDASIGVERGTLVIAGGGQLGPEIVRRFIDLAGGPDAPIVVIPTAGEDSLYPADWRGLDLLRTAGARNLTVRHTKARAVAESDSFVAPIRAARGVWFPGGRQWRLVDSYRGTRTERELHAVLGRGGVVGGTSAGASIQASYLVRGAREGNTVMMAPGYERGFAFLDGVAVDQHVGARQRERDLQQVVTRHPGLLGLGLDEGTAVVVQGRHAEVVGRGALYVHNGAESVTPEQPWFTLRAGETLDLVTRRRTGASGTR